MSIDSIKKLVDIPSPSGYTDDIIDFIENEMKALPYHCIRTYKGSLIVSTVQDPDVMVIGHIDTLGGMVSEITDKGTLRVSQLGGYPPNSFEGEYVTVVTMSGKHIRGTFLVDNPAAHVNKDVKALNELWQICISGLMRLFTQKTRLKNWVSPLVILWSMIRDWRSRIPVFLNPVL